MVCFFLFLSQICSQARKHCRNWPICKLLYRSKRATVFWFTIRITKHFPCYSYEGLILCLRLTISQVYYNTFNILYMYINMLYFNVLLTVDLVPMIVFRNWNSCVWHVWRIYSTLFFFFFQKYEINNIKHTFAFCWVVGS